MIVLDTHVWLWWVMDEPGRLPSLLRERLGRPDETLAISAVSLHEVASLVHKGRIACALPLDEWFDAALRGSGIDCLPVSETVAERRAVRQCSA